MVNYYKNYLLDLNHKVLIQKSGYFARSAAPNSKDKKLIEKTAKIAVKSALNNVSGVVGIDEEKDNELCCIGFNRIKGGKPFNINTNWFLEILEDIGQK